MQELSGVSREAPRSAERRRARPRGRARRRGGPRARGGTARCLLRRAGRSGRAEPSSSCLLLGALYDGCRTIANSSMTVVQATLDLPTVLHALSDPMRLQIVAALASSD